MKHLIDEFKKTASFFQRYTQNLRPIKYVDYENSITFSCMRNSVELVILFKCIDDNNTISCSVSVTDYTTCGEPIQTMKTKVLHSENAFVIKFNSEKLDELYASVIVKQLIAAPDTQGSLVTIVEKTHHLISEFIGEINELYLLGNEYYNDLITGE